MTEAAKMALYLRAVRRITGEWPKALVVHPSAKLDDVIEAVRLAKDVTLPTSELTSVASSEDNPLT